MVVLRLAALTATAEHITHTVQQHRRKPPSQQHRDRKRAKEYDRRLSQEKRCQTDALKNQWASDFVDSGFELLTQTPEYRAHEHEHRDVHDTSQHEISFRCSDSLEVANTNVFARATRSDKDGDTLLHGRESAENTAAVRCGDTQGAVVKMIPDSLCTVKFGTSVEGEPWWWWWW